MSSMNQWQPAKPQAWTDRINEQVDRHGHGLEDHERRIAFLEGRLQLLNSATDEVMKNLSKKIGDLEQTVERLAAQQRALRIDQERSTL